MIEGSARYRHILRFALRYIVALWWFEIALPWLGLGRFARRGRNARYRRIARSFHGLAIALGGLMIKVGQYLSSRLDVLPPEVTGELAGLQDEVPAVPFVEIAALAEAELGSPLDRVYAAVEPTPIAAASLGQAHRARLRPSDASETGFADVVIKVQRPGIVDIVAIDLAALRRVAGWLSRVRFVARHVDLPALVEEFARISLDEINYIAEARGVERFLDSASEHPNVAAPEVVWELTTRRVLTMEDVTAIKVNDVDALRAAGVDPAAVAAEFATVMFDQLFGHGVFHADPHPGNIFVAAEGDGAFTLRFVDFGMMGEIPDALRAGLRKLIIAAATRDGAGLVRSFGEIGVLLPSADAVELERALTALFARFGGMGFAELQEVDPREFRAFAAEFGETVRAMPFQFPENFLLIVRTVSLTSGLCSTLDPGFNIWDAVEPYAQKLLRDQRTFTARSLIADLAANVSALTRLPGRVDDLAARFDEGRVAVRSPPLERRMARIERISRRVVSAVLAAGLLIGGAIVLEPDPVLGTWLMLASVFPALHAVLAGLFTRRR